MTNGETRLRELVAKWRDWNSTKMTPITCADELEAALAAPVQAEVPILDSQLHDDIRKLAAWFLNKWPDIDRAGIYDRFNVVDAAKRIAHGPVQADVGEAPSTLTKCACQPIHSQECQFHDARSSSYRHFYEHELAARPDVQAEVGAGEHLQHVQRFLTEMYQVMVDPVEEFEGNIGQLCALLIERAKQDREMLAARPKVGAGERALAQRIIDLPCIVEVRGPDVVGQIAEQLAGPITDEHPYYSKGTMQALHRAMAESDPAVGKTLNEEREKLLDHYYQDQGIAPPDGELRPLVSKLLRRVEIAEAASRREGRLLTKQECWEAWSASKIKGPVGIRFVEDTPAAWVTRYWSVESEQGGNFLGGVKWWGGWRRYCFFPEQATIFEQDCLRTIADFCEEQTALRKTERAVAIDRSQTQQLREKLAGEPSQEAERPQPR